MSSRTLLLVRWGVFLLACGFLYARLEGQGDPRAFFIGKDLFLFAMEACVVFGLMLLNWGIESWKWRLLVSGLERPSRSRAFAATIAGTSIGLITPNRVGEFAGRVLFLSPENRIPGSFATAVGSIAQFVVTVVMGTAGLIALLFVARPDGIDPQAIAWIALCAVVAFCALVLYFNPDIFRAVVTRLPFVRRWSAQADVLASFSSRTLTMVLALSVLRYLIFTVQFALLLMAFADVHLKESLPAIPVAFLFSTLVPTVMLTELGVRGSVAIAVLSPNPSLDQGVFLSTTALWLVNIALPAMAGAVILLCRTHPGGPRMSSYLVVTVLLFAMAIVFGAVVTGWREAISKHPETASRVQHEVPHITVIVPARNEEANISGVLQDLYVQRYPRERMEVIVVDDGSTDRSVALVQDMLPRWPQLRLLNSDAPGKKAAITTGVEAAQGDLIILTDADVHFSAGRVSAIVSHWNAERSDMIVLPVFTEGRGMLGRLQEDEQAALLGMAMGSAGQGRATLAYGANLAFTRTAFMAVGGYQGDRFASGDDLFLLRRLAATGKRITGLFQQDAMVTAVAAPSPGAFIQQRLRWAGKMRGAGIAMALAGLCALLFPWALLVLTLRFSFTTQMGDHALFTLALLMGAWLCWLLPVIALVGAVRTAAGKGTSVIATLFSLIAFSCYAPVIALASLVVRPNWKGRKV